MDNVLKEWFDCLSEEDKVLLNSLVKRNAIRESILSLERDIEELKDKCKSKEQFAC